MFSESGAVGSGTRLQLGVSAEYLELYNSGIKTITDITTVMRLALNDSEYYQQPLESYRQYPVTDSSTAKRLGDTLRSIS